VLTIAGFDPSGGAGVIADVRTLLAFHCHPVAAITSLTSQNSKQFFGAVHQNGETLRAQILPLVEEFSIAGVKIGMVPTRELVLEIAHLWRERDLPAPVVDPVLHSSSGYELMEPQAKETWLKEIMPLARLITPNIPEAETLAGMQITNETEMGEAAGKLRSMGARAVLIKGGHLKQEADGRGANQQKAIDLLDDDGLVTVLRGDWIDSRPVRGTGCMLSSAIAAGLAHDMSLSESVAAAKEFVAGMIRCA
jgi:hydroxymethylpyrimidine kinase/phosphomethylpyrimidine kinase